MQTQLKRLYFLITILFSFLGCSSSEHVDFPDRNLATAIREELDLRPDAPITIKKLEELKKLNVANSSIKDITGLENSINLLYLTLSENQISDISPLAGLTQLISLNLSNNLISDITPLTQLTNLLELNLSKNKIENIPRLSQLENLLLLFLDENHVSEISELSGLIRLSLLSLRQNNIRDISSLGQLARLSSLQLEHNQIYDISPLYRLSELSDLRLAHNLVSDISALENLQGLEVLHIKENPLMDQDKIRSLFVKKPDLVVDISISDLILQDETRIGLPPEAILRLGKGIIKVMLFSPDGSKIAVGSSIGASVYDVNTGRESQMQVRKAKEISALAFSDNGKTLATSGYNTPIELWDADTGERISIFQGSSKEPLTSVSRHVSSVTRHPGSKLDFSKDTKSLIGLRTDRFVGVLTLWDVSSASLLNRHYGIESNGLASLSSDQSTIAIGRFDGKISIWDHKIIDQKPSLNRKKLLKGHHRLLLGESIYHLLSKYSKKKDQSIRAIALSPDSKSLVSAGTDNSIRLWDLTKGTDHVIYEDLEYWISSLAFSNDGNTIAIGMGKTIRIWDISSNTERSSLEGHTSGIQSVVFSPDGKTLASSSNDGTIRFWNFNIGKELSVINGGYTFIVEKVQFSKDNTTLISSALSNSKEGWDVNTGIRLSDDSIQDVKTYPTKFNHNVIDRIYPKIEDIISYAEVQIFSPDGKLYITVGYKSNRIRIWDIINTGNEILTLVYGHTAPIKTLGFSHDGKTLASAGEDGTILLWDWEKIAAIAKLNDR